MHTTIHPSISDYSITSEEWTSSIEFLTRTGQTCTPIRQEFVLLSDVLGVSSLIDAINNPPVGTATESSVLGPFFTEDAPDGVFRFHLPRILCADLRRSPAGRVDRVGGQGPIPVRRGTRARHQRRAYPRCGHRDMGDG